MRPLLPAALLAALLMAPCAAPAAGPSPAPSHPADAPSRPADAADAEHALRQALARAIRDDHPADQVRCLLELSGIVRSTVRWADAERLLLRAEAIAARSGTPGATSSAGGMDPLLVSDVLEALGNFYSYHRDEHYRLVPSYLGRALALRSSVPGRDSAELLPLMEHLAQSLQNLGDSAAAEAAWKRAIKVREQVSGPDHPELARLLSRLALLYHRQGRHALAEPCYERSLAILERRGWVDWGQAVPALEDLAALRTAAGREEEAYPLLARAEELRRRHDLRPGGPWGESGQRIINGVVGLGLVLNVLALVWTVARSARQPAVPPRREPHGGS